MSTELVVNNESFRYSQEQIDLIKNTVAKGATNDELAMFIGISQKYGLDPFTREIWFFKFGNQPTIMTSRDGYLRIAQDDSNFEGIIGAVVCEGDTFEIDSINYAVNHKYGAKRGPILGAWAKVDHKKRKPVIHFAKFSEYQKNTQIWKQYPSAMILKVAEAMALKRQFGISGLVTKEELGQDLDSMDIIELEPRITTEKARQLHVIALKGTSKEDIPDEAKRKNELNERAKLLDGILKCFGYEELSEKGHLTTAQIKESDYEEIKKILTETIEAGLRQEVPTLDQAVEVN